MYEFAQMEKGPCILHCKQGNLCGETTPVLQEKVFQNSTEIAKNIIFTFFLNDQPQRDIFFKLAHFLCNI